LIYEQNKNGKGLGMEWNLPYSGSQMTSCIIDSSVFGRYWHGVLIDGIVWITGSKIEIINGFDLLQICAGLLRFENDD